MIAAYRLCQRRFAKTAFDGEGARLYGGRWNNVGTRLIYLASSLALAQLEILVHLESDEVLTQKYSFIPVGIPEPLVAALGPADLPKNWRRAAAPPSTRAIGDRWAKALTSAVLRVPSAVVPQEWNYLVNPAHPDFAQLEIGTAKPLAMDPRLA